MASKRERKQDFVEEVQRRIPGAGRIEELNKTVPRISDKGRIGQGSDQDLAELARYTRFSMWKCGSDIIARANRLPTR